MLFWPYLQLATPAKVIDWARKGPPGSLVVDLSQTRRQRLFIAAVCIFAIQASLSLFLRRDPFLPSPPPLASFPFRLGNWDHSEERLVPPETLKVLGADDILARAYYSSGDSQQAEVFVGYYRTQLGAKNAHDPKVCLPGSGWNPVEFHQARIQVPESATSFPVNFYRIKKGDSEQVVLYWFQTHRGVYTFEQQVKAHRVLDSILDNRTDMALVRIIVPVIAGSADQTTLAQANGLAKKVYTNMLPYFPSKKS